MYIILSINLPFLLLLHLRMIQWMILNFVQHTALNTQFKANKNKQTKTKTQKYLLLIFLIETFSKN